MRVPMLAMAGLSFAISTVTAAAMRFTRALFDLARAWLTGTCVAGMLRPAASERLARPMRGLVGTLADNHLMYS